MSTSRPPMEGMLEVSGMMILGTGSSSIGGTGSLALSTGASKHGSGGSITVKVGDGQSGEGGDILMNAGHSADALSGGSVRFASGMLCEM